MHQPEQFHGKYQITTEERARRLAAVRYGVATVGLEGLKVSPEVEEIHQRYAAGDLTEDEFHEQVMQGKAV